jgi:hypothetical protein
MNQKSCAVLFGVLAVGLMTAEVQASPLRYGASQAAQPGVYRLLTALPSVERSWLLSVAAGYGWEADVLAQGDRRQLVMGRLGVGFAPWRFLQIAVTADGVIEGYEEPASDGSIVVGTLGDPRVSLRTGWELGAGFSVGGLFELWIPSGRGSFNLVGDALSPAVFGLLSFAPESVPLGLHLNVGYRHDRSVHMLGDLEQLTREQLLLSGANSGEHRLTVGLAVEYRVGPVAPYIETTGELPLDGDRISHSEVLVGFGSRFYLGPQDVVQLHLGAEFAALGAVPGETPSTSTIYTSPPLVNILFGVAFRLPVRSPGQGETTVGEGCPEPQEPSEEPASPQTGRMTGSVRCAQSSCGDAARVTIVGLGSSAFAPDEESGEFTTAELPTGTYEVVASAEGYQTQRQQVTVDADEQSTVTFDLQPRSQGEPTGIQGRVTDFEGQGVQATIRIPALGVELSCDEDGRFETEADPGRYEVFVSARGFRTQHTQVEVPRNGVAVMNIELRSR